MKLLSKTYEGIKVFYRPGTTDERVLAEVIEQHCYRKAASNFDVAQGETWLDLGANIGAFALYALRLRKARYVECLEPDPENFAVLKKNMRGKYSNAVCNAAITASRAEQIALHIAEEPRAQRTAKDKEKLLAKVRSSEFPNRNLSKAISVRNMWAGDLREKQFDGVKMDIEGSEGLIIDHWYLPKCKKLILEYHTSKDQSVINLMRRLHILKSHFVHVHYPPEFDRMIQETCGTGNFRAFFDRLIYCWEPR